MPRPLNLEGRSPLLQEALKISGGNAGLGKKLKISRQAVNQWIDVPFNRVDDVMKIIRRKT